MLSKREKESRSTKTRLDSVAQPEMYNGGLFWGVGGKAPIRRRLEVGKKRPQCSKICTYLQK